MPAERKRKQSRLKTWMRYLIIALTGSGLGAGGWQLSEHTVLGRLLGIAKREVARGDAPSVLGLKDGLSQVLAATNSFRQSGTYEVRLGRVTVDDTLFSNGQTVNILVRVLKLDTESKETLIWTSRDHGDRRAVVGKDELSFRWPDQPFEISWRPGDRYAVEVWDNRASRSRKVFEFRGVTDDEFPLRTGQRIVARLADGTIAEHPEANVVTFESRWVSNTGAGASGKDRLADRTRTVR